MCGFELHGFFSETKSAHLEALLYFGRVLVPQRLIILSLQHKILLLQNSNDIGGKVLRQSIFSLY